MKFFTSDDKKGLDRKSASFVLSDNLSMVSDNAVSIHSKYDIGGYERANDNARLRNFEPQTLNVN